MPCFGETVAILSLGSDITMDFTRLRSGEKRSNRLIEGSWLILSGELRYDWQHSIAKRKSDMVDGIRVPRSRRVSLTFRNVILN